MYERDFRRLHAKNEFSHIEIAPKYSKAGTVGPKTVFILGLSWRLLNLTLTLTVTLTLTRTRTLTHTLIYLNPNPNPNPSPDPLKLEL